MPFLEWSSSFKPVVIKLDMTSKEFEILPLFEKFVTANNRNKRTMIGGRKLSSGTKSNYQNLYDRLLDFSTTKKFHLRVRALNTSNKRIFNQEKRYNQKFYKAFTDYLYINRQQFDNTVGSNIKNLKVFYKWLNQEEGIITGDFYKNFYVWKEEIPVIVLQPEQLNYLIYDDDFDAKLSNKLKRTKDIFVLGCTVALRVSDLLKLKKSNIETIGSVTYLRTLSKKTGTYTKIKLPPYAVDIIRRNKNRTQNIFRPIGASNLNKYIKQLAEEAGWTYEYPKTRTRRGKPIVQYKNGVSGRNYRFCDLLSTHTMRRTAITTMLNLGVDEGNIRKISGHSPGSKEFYKYVKYSQSRVDDDLDIMYEKLAEKRLVLTK